MNLPSWICAQGLLLVFLVSTTHAEDAESSPQSAAEAAVRAVLSDYVTAFNRGDVEALGSKWTEQGVFVNESSGERTVSRDAIVQNLAALIEEESDLTLGGRVDAVRFIRPDVAQISGHAVTVRPGEEPSDSTFTAILVRDGRKWLFDSIHETRVPPAAKPYDQLQALEFLVGRWVDDTEEARVESTIRWGANQSFLVRTTTVHRDDDHIQQGTQVIGWDPRQERIRCWMFDSDGSFGEGIWSPGDDGWTVKFTQTLSDGRRGGATQVISLVDRDTLTFQLIGREVEGKSVPSSEPVRVVRVGGESDE